MPKILPLSLLLFLGFSAFSLPTLPLEELDLLASPTFEGRGVGTAGLGRARDLLAAWMEEASLTRPFQTQAGASYVQEFRVFIGNELGPANGFAGAGEGEFLPLAFSRSGSVKGAELVFAGFGITARQEGQLIYDDYQGLDVRGKVVIVFTGDPGTGNPGSPFRDPAYYHYSSPMYKVQNAELHGAAGIVLVRDPLSLSGAEPPLRFQGRQGGGSTAAVLAGQLSLARAESLVGQSLRGLQEKIAASQKPSSFALNRRADLTVDLKRVVGSVENVAGFLPGSDPAKASEFIVIGAHYDHLGYGGDSSMDPEGTGKIHHGADDNASGVQAVLNLAREIKATGGNRRPLLFVFFTAEEVGLLGSKHFTENLPLPEGARAVAMLNLDMVGRLSQNRLSVLALRSGKEFSGIVEEVNQSFGFDLMRGDSGFGSSDHASFLQLKIPSLFFTTGAHQDYHRPSDTAEKINRQGLLRVQAFAKETWKKIDGAESPPTYDPTSEDPEGPPRGGRGYGVYFGSVPEFEQGSVPGVLLQGVRPGSPAEQAGLRGGDLLTGLGEIRIRNLHDLVFALRFYRPNEEVEVEWVREGLTIRAKTVLRKREE